MEVSLNKLNSIEVISAYKRKTIQYVINEKGCWICTSHGKDNSGYPVIVQGEKTIKVSRYMYERFVDQIPKGLHMLHSCDDPSCININHLRPGTSQDNVNDRQLRHRWSHCTGIKGEAHWSAKLTYEKVAKIRNDTRTQKVIATEYGVRFQTIGSIKRNEIWKI